MGVWSGNGGHIRRCPTWVQNQLALRGGLCLHEVRGSGSAHLDLVVDSIPLCAVCRMEGPRLERQRNRSGGYYQNIDGLVFSGGHGGEGGGGLSHFKPPPQQTTDPLLPMNVSLGLNHMMIGAGAGAGGKGQGSVPFRVG